MLRMLFVLIIVALVAAWWLGYIPGYRPVPGYPGSGSTSPTTSSGPIDSSTARERGAQLGERTADAANRVARGIDDGAITAKITSKMALDDTVRARDIRVHTQGGVVTLTGTVASQAEHQKALQLARDTDGVHSVVDQLQVRR